MKEERFKEYCDLYDMLKIVAPGTPIREGLENILKAKTGALIVVGDSKEVMAIVDGGFRIDKEYSPASLYELAKMDGAIILSGDLKRILFANAFLMPDPLIKTEETGTRHKSAQRTAKQTGEYVISISQRRNIITVYRGSEKHIIREVPAVMARANQALQTLEKYKSVLNGLIDNLTVLEFEDIVTFDDVAVVVQRTEMVMRIVSEIERYICELGNEGRLISMQLDELKTNVEDNVRLIIEDYMIYDEGYTNEEAFRHIGLLSYEDLMDTDQILRAIGYREASSLNSLESYISPRGYRLISRIRRVPMAVVRNLVDTFRNLQGVLNASIKELDAVEGIGEVRARKIKDGLKRIKEQALVDNRRV